MFSGIFTNPACITDQREYTRCDHWYCGQLRGAKLEVLDKRKLKIDATKGKKKVGPPAGAGAGACIDVRDKYPCAPLSHTTKKQSKTGNKFGTNGILDENSNFSKVVYYVYFYLANPKIVST